MATQTGLMGAALAFAIAWVASSAQDLRPVPALAARVTDLTGTLDASQTQAIEAGLASLEMRKGAQVAVLLVPTTAPETIEQYATRVFDAWKLGRKGVDDGALVIVAKNDHRVRIEVGYGLEGAIPDAAAKRVAHDYMSPKFAAGDFAGGVVSGTDALIALIADEPLPPPAASDGLMPPMAWWNPVYLALGLLLGGISAVLMLILFTRPRVYRVLLGHLPARVRPFAVGCANALPIGLLLRNPLSAAVALLAGAGLAAVAGLARPPAAGMRGRAGAASSGSAWATSDSGSSSGSYGSSDSSGSSGSDFSGGGGSSGGGGASDSW